MKKNISDRRRKSYPGEVSQLYAGNERVVVKHTGEALSPGALA